MRFSFILMFIISNSFLFATPPEWISKLPFSEDFFWGVGVSHDQDIAIQEAKKEILMQLSCHVEASISIEISGHSNEFEYEKFDSYFSSNELRGAEISDVYKDNEKIWVLMKYCNPCAEALMKSVIYRYEDTSTYDSSLAVENLGNEWIYHGYRVKRRLEELGVNDYSSENVIIKFSELQISILIINFLPNSIVLSENQKENLMKLSITLLDELRDLNYRSIDIIGHANPTGKDNEEEELQDISRHRAETMAYYLEEVGFSIADISWIGGEKPIADMSTVEGRSLNRRVEVIIRF